MSDYYSDPSGSFDFDKSEEEIRNAPVDPWNESGDQSDFYGTGFDEASFAASYPSFDAEDGDVSATNGDDAGEPSQALVIANGESSATADQHDGQGQVAVVEDDDEEDDGPADDSSDIGGFDSDDLHRELLLANRRDNRLRKYDIANDVTRVVGELIAFKDADWAMIKADLEETIENLRKSRDDFKEKFKQLQESLAATPALEPAGSTQGQDILAEKAAKLADLDQQIGDKTKEVERLDEFIASKVMAGNGQASNLGAGDVNADELVRTINEAREENANLRSQLNAAPKAWPTRIQDLPEGDAIRVEILNMMATASGNYNRLQGDANDLRTQFNHATGPSGQLQLEINRLNGLVKPLNDQLDTKNQLIESLQKEIQRLMTSESDVKKQADRKIQEMQQTIDKSASFASTADNALAAKQTLLDTATADLATANRKIKALEAEKKHELAAAGKEVSALRFAAKKSADKVLTLESELKAPRADNDVLLKAKKAMADLEDVEQDNKLLRRANFKLVENSNKEINRLRDINTRLVHMMNEPKRKFAVLKARQDLMELKRAVDATELAVAVREEQLMKEKKDEEEEEKKKKKMEKKKKVEVLPRVEIAVAIPGGWSDNAKLADPSVPSLPAPEIVIAGLSSCIKVALNRKVAAVQNAALHVKYTGIHLWNLWKTRIFWAVALLASFLAFFGKDLVNEEPDFTTQAPQHKHTSVRGKGFGAVDYQPGDTELSSAYEQFVFGMPIVGCLILSVLLCRLLTQRKLKAENDKYLEAERVLREAVQADVLARKQAQEEVEEAARLRWQEGCARQPFFFESLRRGWGMIETLWEKFDDGMMVEVVF
ncbi:hypothetical protein DL95DRAFT_417230 [Leptodontidium sp. 2 PMI_412]|nr:hypothetical protein DL95DRAFT_417230 [Leptodontidium sp. 2 PMI_412]